MTACSHFVVLGALTLACSLAVRAEDHEVSAPVTNGNMPAGQAQGEAVASLENKKSLEEAMRNVELPLTEQEQQLSNLLSKWQMELNRWAAKLEAAAPEQREELLQLRPDGSRVANEIWKLIRPHLREAWVIPGIDWFLRNPGELSKFPPPTPEKVTKALLDSIEFYLAGEPQVKDVCPGLVKFNHPRSVSILEKIFTINKDKITKGHAALALALKYKLEGGGDDESVVKLRGGYLKYVLENVTGADFGAPFGDSKVVDVIKEELYQINNLTLSQKAPRIEAMTLEGTPFDTNALKGKTVLIVFVNPAFNDVLPVLENLEKMYQELSPQGLQMVLVSPLKVETMKEVIKEHPLSMPVISDAEGKIHHDYRMNKITEAFLLDKNGKICFKKTPSVLLTMAARQLLEEMKPGGGKRIRTTGKK